MDKASKTEPLISVIIPVYNVEKYLDRCMESVINQTYKNIEIILINDGSTDNSGELCKKWQKLDKRVKLFEQENQGQSKTRNTGIIKSIGTYITFIDSDDYISKNYVQKLYTMIQKSNADISVTSHNIMYPKKTIINKNSDQEEILDAKKATEKMLYGKIDVSIWGKLYHKKCFNNTKYPENKSYEDVAITPIIFAQSSSIIVSPEITYYYVINKNSVTTTKNYQKKIEHIEMTERMSTKIIDIFPDLKPAAMRRNMYARLSVLSQFAAMKKVPKKYTADIISYIRKNSNKVLSDKNISKRDRLGIYCAKCGYGFYKAIWNLLKSSEGRN